MRAKTYFHNLFVQMISIHNRIRAFVSKISLDHKFFLDTFPCSQEAMVLIAKQPWQKLEKLCFQFKNNIQL